MEDIFNIAGEGSEALRSLDKRYLIDILMYFNNSHTVLIVKCENF